MVTDEGASTRDRLVQHGRDLFLEVGPALFSLREVARRVGVSAPAIYRHFSNKEALLGAVCEEGFRTFSRYLMRALAAGTPLERMRATGDQYCAFALEHPRDYRVIFQSAPEELGAAVAPAPTGAPTFQFLVDRVRECIDAHVIGPGDAVELAVGIWANVHGLVALRLSGHLPLVGDDAAFARLFRASSDRYLRGLAP